MNNFTQNCFGYTKEVEIEPYKITRTASLEYAILIICLVCVTVFFNTGRLLCLVFRGGQRYRTEGCQSTGAMHPWYLGAPGNKGGYLIKVFYHQNATTYNQNSFKFMFNGNEI